MVDGLNGIPVVNDEILPFAESEVNRFAQHEILRYTQDDRLRRENYDFNIFCSNKDLDGSLLQGVAFDEWVNYNADTKVWYSSIDNILPVLQREIKKEKPDHLFIVGMYDWQYNFKPLLFCRGVKKIISVRGMLHPGALSQKSFKKKLYLLFWKLTGLYKKNIFHATDVAEKKYIQQVFGTSASVKIAANFPKVLDVQPVVKKEMGHLKLVSIALISAMKNILLVLEALGNVNEELLDGSDEILRYAQDDKLRGDYFVPDYKLHRVVSVEYNIYGPIKDKKYWEVCTALIKKMPKNIKVNYHGDIPSKEIATALAVNHVFILPSKSENFGHAIYEALTAGRPVITSTTTPWNKLEATKAGINISLIDKQELINAIKFFAGINQAELEIWSRGAKTFAEGAIKIDEIRMQYEIMFG